MTSFSDYTIIMTSSYESIFQVTGLLCGEFTGDRWIPLTKASDAKLWCFILSAPGPTVEQTMATPVIRDAIALIMTSLWWRRVYGMETLPAWRIAGLLWGESAVIHLIQMFMHGKKMIESIRQGHCWTFVRGIRDHSFNTNVYAWQENDKSIRQGHKCQMWHGRTSPPVTESGILFLQKELSMFVGNWNKFPKTCRCIS